MHLFKDGKPTTHAIRVFTEGDCWLLAWYLYDMTGFQIVTIETYLAGWAHAFVRIDDDRYLDITGVYSRDEIMRRWGATKMKVHTGLDSIQDLEQVLWWDFNEAPHGYEWTLTPHSYRRARESARKLLDIHGL